jgi:hypothetical protein
LGFRITQEAKLSKLNIFTHCYYTAVLPASVTESWEKLNSLSSRFDEPLLSLRTADM